MIVERKYGVGTVIETALVDTADDKAILTGATFADGDMKVSSDQQALTNGAAEYAAFTSGSEEPQPGDTISNNSQTAVVCGCFLTSGTWSGGDASGYIFLEQVSGALASGQVDISGGTSDVMTLSGDTTVRAIVASGYRVLVGLTSTELSCRELTCQIKDQGSDTWLDDGFKVSTYGNANAAHVFDRSTAAVTAAAIRTEIDDNSTKLASILNEVQYPDGWVYIDTTGGSAGSTLGTHGTLRNPVDNLDDAITLATALGSYRIKEVGPGTAVSSLTIANVDLTGFIIDLNGARWTFGSSVTTFYTTWMNGELAGSTIAGGTPVKMDVGDRFVNVLVYNVLSISGSGILERCTIADGLHLASGSVDVACTEMLTTGNTSIDFNSLSGTIRLHGINGDATVKNMAGGTLCYYGRGQVTLEASCTGGTLAHTADVKITNGGTTTTSLVTSGATNASIADAVLDEAMSGHTTAGTLGKAVSDILVDTGTDGVVVAAASKTGYALSASGVDAILDEAITEPDGMFAWGSATLRNIIGVLGALLRNKVTSDSNSVDVRNDDDDATLWSYATSDDDTTFTSGEGT